MKRHLVSGIKLALVALLMWFVFGSIHFEDRLVFTDEGATGDTVTSREQVIEIQGHWQQEPVLYTIGDDPDVQQANRGEQPDGTILGVEPGFLTYWRNLDPYLFVLGALLYVVTVMMAGTRWWWLLRVNGTGVSLLETLRFTWIGIFFNTVVPGATGGDLIKAIYIMKRCPGHRVQVLVSVGVDRVLGLGSLALLGAFAVLFALDDFGEIAFAIWGVILGVCLLGAFAFSRRLRNLVKLKWLLHRLPSKLRNLLQLVDRAIYFYRGHPWVIAGSLLAGVALHVLSVLCALCIGEAIGVGMPAYGYFVLVPVINIVSAVPIGPNGWGIGEAAYYKLFGEYGFSYAPGYVAGVEASRTAAEATMGTRGVALSVLYRLVLTFFSLLGGLFVLFEKDRVTKADIDREVALEDDEAHADDDSPADRGAGGTASQ